ncbi:MAG TPA: hypothetical protein DEO86_09250 [Colwellia sp.]|nr:hypothetical protein [Colwellia sp.]|tara:strand:+ start:206 stop:790 length:585 start_codon:yes stop_codon:yes gene_type:complete
MKRKVGRPSKADLKAKKQAKDKQNILYVVLAVGIFLLGGIIAQAVNADELVHKFGNPSFSGINQSAHYLTIDEQERTRKEKIAQDVQDKLEEAEREAENTVLAKFIRNLQSRIYSTLAKDISESLFNYGSTPTIANPVSGEINLEGNILRWVNNGVTITLTIEEWFDGVLISTTEIVIPIGSFGGCWVDCDGGG